VEPYHTELERLKPLPVAIQTGHIFFKRWSWQTLFSYLLWLWCVQLFIYIYRKVDKCSNIMCQGPV